jgi:hypothetical protein
MKFDELVEELLESTSSLRNLYHITLMANAAMIINRNYFSLSEQDTSGKKLFGNRYKYYMSCARNLTSSYFQEYWDDLTLKVIFELDAAKLSDNGYVIKPIHDFAHYGKNYKNIFELEDRILSNKRAIENANNFIKSINFLYPKTFAHHNSQATNRKFHVKYTISDAFEIFRSSGIPTYVYEDPRAFSRLDKRKAELL